MVKEKRKINSKDFQLNLCIKVIEYSNMRRQNDQSETLPCLNHMIERIKGLIFYAKTARQGL